MRELQSRAKQVADAAHLVSFTVDPTYDTPEVLSEYARNNRVSGKMWSFLTGTLIRSETRFSTASMWPWAVKTVLQEITPGCGTGLTLCWLISRVAFAATTTREKKAYWTSFSET